MAAGCVGTMGISSTSVTTASCASPHLKSLNGEDQMRITRQEPNSA
jgi:hypothetical protein